MATSEAHKRASAKYDAKAYHKKLLRFKHSEWDKFKEYTERKGYTDNGFIIKAIMYCIDNEKEFPENEE